jgi:hypothetical protein
MIFATLSPYSTQTLQLLGVVNFKPLCLGYASELDGYLQQSQGLSLLMKADFFSLFCPVKIRQQFLLQEA